MNARNVFRRFLGAIRQAWDIEKHEPPSDTERDEAVAALNQKLTIENASTARFLLSEIKDCVEKKRSAHRTIEGKATSIIGFASAALAFATAFRNGALLLSWLVLPGLIAQFAAIIFAVAVLFLRQGAIPNMVLYNYWDIVADVKNEARIATALVETWSEYERTLDASGTVRGARLDLAIAAYIAGLIYIVALSAWSVAGH